MDDGGRDEGREHRWSVLPKGDFLAQIWRSSLSLLSHRPVFRLCVKFWWVTFAFEHHLTASLTQNAAIRIDSYFSAASAYQRCSLGESDRQPTLQIYAASGGALVFSSSTSSHAAPLPHSFQMDIVGTRIRSVLRMDPTLFSARLPVSAARPRSGSAAV